MGLRNVSVIEGLSSDASLRAFKKWSVFLTLLKVFSIVSRCVDQLVKKLQEKNLDEPIDMKQYDAHVIFQNLQQKTKNKSF